MASLSRPSAGTASVTELTVVDGATFDTTVLVVDDDNNRIGINTATPTAALEIDGDVQLTPTAISTAHVKTTGSLDVRCTANLKLGTDGADSIRLGRTNSTGAKIHLRSGADTDLVVTNSKVGIGTEDPKTDLTVEGTITLKEQAAADGDTAAYGQLWVKTATPNQLYFTTDAGDDIQITSGTSLSESGDITGVTAGTGISGGGTSGAVTLNLDTHSLTEAAIADGDFIVFNDATDSNAPKREALADVATLFAGTGLTASSSVINVDASQTQITAVGTIATGTWQGTAIARAYIANDAINGDKIADDSVNSEHYAAGSIDEEHLNATNSPTDNYILSYDDASGGFTWVAAGAGASVLDDLTDVTYSSGDLTISSLDTLTTSASAHNAAGTAVKIQGGSTTAGTTNNIAGGALTLAGGQGKGSGAGGDIIFQVANAGGSGSSLNSLATALTISDDKSAEFESTIAGRTSMTVLNTTTSAADQGGSIKLQCDDGAAMGDGHRLGVIEFTGAEDGSNNLTIGARIEALCDAAWSATENGASLLFYTTDGNASQSEVLKLDSNKLASFAGAVSVTGDTTVANNLYAGKFISHTGDTHTRIVFPDAGDQILFEAGGVEMLALVEGSQDEIVINNPSADVDFRVESDDETHMFFVDANNNRISIGDSTDAPAATLEITNHASAGATGVPLLQLNSNDVDQECIDINAANTTKEVINITADALTTGAIMKLVSDSSSTGTRSLIDVTNDNTAATGTSLMLLKNDAAGGGGIIVESTAAETKPLLDLINSSNNADKPPILAFTKIDGAADDYQIGKITFTGENSAGTPESIEYVSIVATASDTTDGDEGGQLSFYVMGGGTGGTASSIEAIRIGQERVNNADGSGTPPVQAFQAIFLNPSSGDCDVVMHGDGTSNMFRLNAGDDRIGIGAFPDQASAILEIESTTKGFLPPRMNTTQQNAISSPANGLMLYNTSTHKLMCYVNGSWTAMH